jgi:hypothetical protein
MFACGDTSDDTDPSGDSTSNLTAKDRTIDANRLVEDEDIIGVSNVTVEQVQALLDQKKSFLASFSEDGRTAAQIIVEESKKNEMNPVYMLARIQGESSLVESQSPNQKLIEKATGCGCPDGKGCADQYKGFSKQITCTSTLMKKYFTSLDTKGETVAGWSVGKSNKTLDPCTVTPANRATAALYTYTPWVGEYAGGCGTSGSMGSSGIAFLLKKYKGSFPNAPTAASSEDGTATAPAVAAAGSPGSSTQTADACFRSCADQHPQAGPYTSCWYTKCTAGDKDCDQACWTQSQCSANEASCTDALGRCNVQCPAASSAPKG